MAGFFVAAEDAMNLLRARCDLRLFQKSHFLLKRFPHRAHYPPVPRFKYERSLLHARCHKTAQAPQNSEVRLAT